MSRSFRLSGFNARRRASVKTLEAFDPTRLKATGLGLSMKTRSLDQLGQAQSISRIAFEGSLDAQTAKWLSQIRHCPELGFLGTGAFSGKISIPGLTLLYFVNCPGLLDLSLFAGNKEITALHIEGCLKLESLKGIEKLREIKELVILGAGASSPTLDSLKPLKSLTNLNYLRIYAKVKDASLAPLVGLKELALLDLPNRFSTHDYEQILLHSPKLKSIGLHNGVFHREKGFVRAKD